MKFRDIVGHQSEIDHLRRMVDDDRIPHALLISGAPGSGKFMLARAFAQYIHCTDKVNGDACGRCPSCRQHQSLNNADMYYVFPVVKNNKSKGVISDDYMDIWKNFLHSNPYMSFERWLEAMGAANSQPRIYVDEAASILHKVNLSNFSAKYKLMLIWLPEKLVEETANKLLKIIEEPFGDTKFIFVSNSPQLILSTIFSRTQRINIPPLTTQEISYALETIHGLDAKEAYSLGNLSSGNMNYALARIEVTDESHEFKSDFQEIMRKAYARDVAWLKDWSESRSAWGREKLKRFFLYCASMVRENFIYNLQKKELLRLDAEEIRFSSRFAPFIHPKNVERMIAETDRAASDIAGNANARIILFDYCIQLIVLIKTK